MIPGKSIALSAIAIGYTQLADDQAAQAVLANALENNTYGESLINSRGLEYIAMAYGQLADATATQVGLENVLSVIDTIDFPFYKSEALSALAVVYGQLGDSTLLLKVQKAAAAGSHSSVLATISTYQALYGNWGAALRILRTTLESDKVGALAQMLTYHAESKTPQLIDGPKVTAVNPTPIEAGQYKLAVTIQSPDESCERHADWWEVLTEEGDLITRQLLDSPHGFEKPFTTETTLTVDPAQALILRAHFSNSIIQRSYYDPIFGPEYSNQAMKGSIEQGFKSVRIPPRFAARVERQAPQPGVCKDK